MSRWFRFYDEVLDDPKVQRLPAEDFKNWTNLLCLASRNDGRLPAFEDIAFALRMPENAIETLVERLHNAGLIDRRNGGANGSFYTPHGWDKRQFKSDTSTERVKRFRQRSETVTETPPETEADTETETDNNRPRKRAVSMPKPEEVNEAIWGDFKKHRRAKKAPVTPSALAGIQREANAAGWSLEAALSEMMARGWQGFKSDWVENKAKAGAPDWGPC